MRQEPDGIDLDDLDAVVAARARGRPARPLLYVVPNFQNPTGLLIAARSARGCSTWAARRDLLIVEDDPYGDAVLRGLRASAADTRPIKADDAEGRVVYLSSFSKTLAPGFRVAWIAAPEPIVAEARARQAGRGPAARGALDQRIVYEACRRGILDGRLPMLRASYQHKRDVMEQALRAASWAAW